MISDEEKAKIVERIQFETQIRNDLAKSEKEQSKAIRWSWLESKLGILLIGALISGILVPLFQFTQEKIKWTRQNRYENMKYRLEMVRNGIKELTFIHAFVAEAYERTRPFVNNETPDAKMLKSYQSQIIEMNNRRFLENAKFVASLSYFAENERAAILEAFNEYLSSVHAFISLLDNRVGSRKRMSRATVAEATGTAGFDTALRSLMDEIGENYQYVFSIMQRYLGRLEDESIRYM
jgi:hypothetical protein